jgi:hypothetical protein
VEAHAGFILHFFNFEQTERPGYKRALKKIKSKLNLVNFHSLVIVLGSLIT